MRRSISFAALLVVAAACIASAAAAPNVQFNKVMPEAGEGGKETIVLQNVGDAAADLTGWSIVESGSAAKPAYFFGGDTASYQRNPTQWCSNFTSLGAGEEMSLYPYNRDRFSSDFMPCGVRFELPYNGQLELRNAAGKPVDTVSWKAAKENMAIYRMGNQYVTFHEGSDLASSIEGSPMLRLFAKALEKTGVMNDYLVDGATIKVSEDSWLGKKLKQDGYGKTYYKGPYTVFAPSDDAFASFMKEMGWFGMTLTEDELMAMPELEDILKYHIVVGQAYSESIANNTGLVSMKDGSEVAVFKGKKQEFLVHDDCVDRPSPDDYGCRMQVSCFSRTRIPSPSPRNITSVPSSPPFH